jgi:hypothetical protein
VAASVEVKPCISHNQRHGSGFAQALTRGARSAETPRNQILLTRFGQDDPDRDPMSSPSSFCGSSTIPLDSSLSKGMTSWAQRALKEGSFAFAAVAVAVAGAILAVPGLFDLLAFVAWPGAVTRRSCWVQWSSASC